MVAPPVIIGRDRLLVAPTILGRPVSSRECLRPWSCAWVLPAVLTILFLDLCP